MSISFPPLIHSILFVYYLCGCGWVKANGYRGISIGNAFYSTDAATYTPKLISRLESLVEEVYKNGGRKFLFLNVPPTSRSPLFLDQGEEVVEQHAAYLAVYNENLEGMVERFNKGKGDVSFSFLFGLFVC